MASASLSCGALGTSSPSVSSRTELSADMRWVHLMSEIKLLEFSSWMDSRKVVFERKGATHSSNSPESSALLGKGAGLYRKGHELIEVSLLRGWWLLARCWDWERGER